MADNSWAVSGPDYNPDTWSLGYQGRQFGVAADPEGRPASVYSALTDPPAAMTTAIELPFPPVDGGS